MIKVDFPEPETPVTQTNNPASTTVNEATAIVENITKFREGSVEIIEVEINDDTTTGTFVNGETIEGASYDDPNTVVKLTVSQSVATTTITTVVSPVGGGRKEEIQQ